jgi:ADP-heptose:LPS heptosyltransferase
MNVTQLQRIDRWLGVPVCFLLTLCNRLFGSTFTSAGAPKKLLFVKLAEQGSTVLAYPAIRRAIKLVGRENLYFVVFDDNRFILDAMNVVPRENIITISFKGLPSMLSTAFEAIRRLRALHLDAALDLEFFARGSAILTFLSGARARVGFHAFFGAGPYRGNLMTHRLLYNSQLHTSQTFVAMLDALLQSPDGLPAINVVAADPHEMPPAFLPLPEELEVVEKLVQELPSHDRLVILNPNASDLLPLRRWPAGRYVELARRLLAANPDLAVVMAGAPGEAGLVRELAESVGSMRCLSLAGRTTLRQLLVLFTLADVLITNDSGPAHFAALTPIQVVTLFGPETPALYGALSPGNTSLWAGLVCSPCVSAYNNRRSSCRNNVCMQALSVDRVYAAVEQALQRGSARPPLRSVHRI